MKMKHNNNNNKKTYKRTWHTLNITFCGVIRSGRSERACLHRRFGVLCVRYEKQPNWVYQQKKKLYVSVINGFVSIYLHILLLCVQNCTMIVRMHSLFQQQRASPSRQSKKKNIYMLETYTDCTLLIWWWLKCVHILVVQYNTLLAGPPLRNTIYVQYKSEPCAIIYVADASHAL